MERTANFDNRELIEFKFSEVFRRLDRMEQTMNGFAFAKQTDLDELAKELRSDYVKKDSLRWIQNIVGGIFVGVGIAIIVGVFKLLGARL